MAGFRVYFCLFLGIHCVQINSGLQNKLL